MKMLTFDLPLVRMLPYFPPHTLRQLLLLENRWMEWEREQATLLVKSTRNEKFSLTGANSSGVERGRRRRRRERLIIIY